MKIFVRAKPNSKEERVEKIGKYDYLVSVRESPIKGRANKAIIGALADYFKISPSRIWIRAGLASKNKIIEIETSYEK
ncbi:MAG: hypothetical protein COT61_05375 [Candidatus Portnoybacteria bacterium CG09_land_8_20_14_0_10_44_13]|uniref:Uncharacterized protein n=3 Tax=Candidatus Portnoyibacteriota TaxID=1817913 RepID=A0A2H0WW79_9BACT|nr:MAG: hypothetical protein AUK17_03870 [Parcubacteria group bacterium CG2_30_44_18]PIS16169.1 MAG: hypothetical protein COT61_05375 [Candidatus Portnoybacteria bacterium CG09_land_8_20_14_0_10_44_13]PIZ70682.1 MAG: hypothetical protein COY11_02355 [Candidatus Portnoybacteria bacterium CG_4_10_14_0_2_um_filter_44_20]PJA63046.1 MAG: hypothetical protein CO161_03070 [Candidatus Portnoybacteria bacterium CG_4_9_14_3_um_filter_44_9]